MTSTPSLQSTEEAAPAPAAASSQRECQLLGMRLFAGISLISSVIMTWVMLRFGHLPEDFFTHPTVTFYVFAVSQTVMLTLSFLMLFGVRWASWVIAIINMLGALASLVVGAALMLGEQMLRDLGVTLGNTGQTFTWLLLMQIYSVLVMLMLPRSRFLVLSGAVVCVVYHTAIALLYAQGPMPIRLTNPITHAAASELGDPASGYRFTKPDGYSGYLWRRSKPVFVVGGVVMLATLELPGASEVYLDDRSSTAVFVLVERRSPETDGKWQLTLAEAVSRGVAEVGRRRFEERGQIFEEREFYGPEKGSRLRFAALVQTASSQSYNAAIIAFADRRYYLNEADTRLAARRAIDAFRSKFELIDAPPPTGLSVLATMRDPLGAVGGALRDAIKREGPVILEDPWERMRQAFQFRSRQMEGDFQHGFSNFEQEFKEGFRDFDKEFERQMRQVPEPGGVPTPKPPPTPEPPATGS